MGGGGPRDVLLLVAAATGVGTCEGWGDLGEGRATRLGRVANLGLELESLDRGNRYGLNADGGGRNEPYDEDRPDQFTGATVANGLDMNKNIRLSAHPI